MKKVLLLCFFIIVGFRGFAQTAALYSFQAFSAPYVSIAPTGTAVGAIICDDCRQRNIPVPFNFVFCGVPYNNISMCSNGWVSLANNGATTFTPSAANVNSPGWLMPFWADHEGSRPACGTTSFAYYTTQGTAPNRVFIMEWRDFNAWNWAGVCACCLSNFQLKLYETSGVIDFCYGTSTMNGLIDGTIGIANSTTDWQTLNNVSPNPTPSSTVFRTNLSTLPGNNQVYRWTPCPLTLSPTNNSPVCAGGTLNLTGTAGGGATGFGWTGPGGYTSGVQNPSITPVTPAHAGTYTFTATQGTCSISAVTTVTVNVAPPANTGATSVCVGGTITLNNAATTLGTWTTSAPGIANVNSATGVVTGVAPGTAVISYVNVCGSATTSVVVYPNPGPITGTTLSCVGTPVTLSNSLSGGTWTSSNPAIAGINLTTGVVNPIGGGNTNIIYIAPGNCSTSISFNVAAGPNPFVITPNAATFCAGYQMLTAPPILGATVSAVWASSAPFNVPDNSAAGATNTINVSGIPAGATINSTAAVLDNVSMAQDGQLVFNLQSPIGNTLCLVNRQGGSGANFINTEVSTAAALPFSFGAPPYSNLYVADGVSLGAPTLGVGPAGLPANVTSWAPLTVIPSGNWVLGVRDYVAGTTATVNQWSMKMSYTTQPGGYVWTPAAGLYTDAGLTTPYVAGTMVNTVFASPSATTVYTATGTITGLPCTTTSTATITIAGAGGSGGITGNTSICQGSTSQLSSILSGGTWSSTNSTVATVSASGVVSGATVGTAVISYYNGCLTTATVTVNPALPAITGNTVICPGATTTLNNTIAGTWTSSATPIATTAPGLSNSNTVTGGSPGTAVITVTAPTGCQASTSVIVLPLPGPISGPSSMCAGATAALSNAVTGGTWSSSNLSIATVAVGPSAASTIYAAAPGTVTITYSNGCASPTLSVLVKGVPTAITGATNVCSGSTITLSNAIPNGTWVSVAPLVASVDSFTGVVTGGTTAGPVTIIYSTGCGVDASIVVTNNVVPSVISGTTAICYGGSATLSNNGLPTGTWTSSNSSVATVNPSTGVVSGGSVTAGGITTITATNTCGSTSVTFSVSAQPVLSGITTFCQNGSTTLSSTLGSGTWSSSNVSVATTNTVGNPGVIVGTGIGFTPGSSVITHVNSAGCSAVITITTTPTPTAITGIMGVCVGSVTNLTNITAGGVWSSSNSNVATVTNTGNVWGAGGGSTVISYTIGTCGASATVTVDPLPGTIIGPSIVCVTNTIMLSNATTPGFWSSGNPGAATVNAATGEVGGVSPPGANITYSTPAGCITTKSITVAPSPGTGGITGITTLCAGQSSQLSNSIGTGTWSSTNPVAGIIGANTGLFITNTSSFGTTIISYTTPAGCHTTTVITVNPMPSPIVGPSAMCSGTTATLIATPAGGTWASSAPVIASIDVNTGVLTAGALPGTAVISYALASGCSVTLTVTVNQMPPAITGNTAVCVGSCTALSNSLAGGTWSSVTPATATVNATGVTCGSSIGTSVISYTRAGCAAVTTVTVNPLPVAIIGPTAVCVGSVINLTNTNAGGTWSSSNNTLATVDANTGAVTGVNPGSPSIIYTLPTGCSRSVAITVNTLPLPIAGAATMCATSTATLSSGIAAGTWSSSNPAVASVAPGASTTTLITAGSNPGGTTVITYSITATGCASQLTVTVNPIPAPILGATVLCIGSATQLTDITPGGVWSSSAPAIASVNTTGLVNGIGTGTARITYANPVSGCFVTTSVTVNGLPTVIGGVPTVCVNSTTQLSNGTGGGIWSVSNGNASVNSSGVVSGITAGTTTVTYTLGTGCIQTIDVTINPLPANITGTFVICKDATTTLSDATPSGAWSSSNTNIITVTPSGGVVTGVNAGSARVTYTLSTTGCAAVATMTVNPLPGVMSGASTVCEGSTISISNTVGGGAWTSSNTTIATVGTLGTQVLVGGIAAGVVDISYTLGTGCAAVKTVTVAVQPVPIIGVPVAICQGAIAELSDATPGGVWTSGTVSVATVDAGLGIVYASATTIGSTNISYTIGSCRSVGIVNVKAQPGAITGNKTICQGSTTILSSTVALGVWTSDNLPVATVNPATGMVFGSAVNTGTANITYTLNGCPAMTTVTVTPQPGPIAGANSVCNTNCISLSNPVSGGVWSTNSTLIATVNPTTGLVCGIGVGNATITYAIGSCIALKVVTVNVQPGVIAGPTQVCNGAQIQLSNSAGAGAWTTSNPAVATVTGTGLVTGLSVGTAVITMQVGVCYATTTITVNPPPSAITGIFYLCQNSTTTLGNLTPGGTWSSGNNAVATVGFNTGIVTGVTTGTARITYTLITTGCSTSQTVSVISAPAPIQGPASVCLGGSVQMSDITNGGTWTSSDPSVAGIGSTSGIATGIASGTVVISYTLGTGCRVITPLVVYPMTINSGPTSVCEGLSIALSNATIGGSWSSNNSTVATVHPATGVVTGAGSGTAVIAYTLPSGCAATTTVSVAPAPSPIIGLTSVCMGQSISLTDTTAGGVWSSQNISIADVDGSGIVTGMGVGSTNISYTAGGCPRIITVTVNGATSPITGTTTICLGNTTDLNDATAGGTWFSSNPSVATIDTAGIVTSVGVGTTTIIYTPPTGCLAMAVVTVNSLPGAIAGPTDVCVGSTIALTNSVAGGAWSSSNYSVADVGFANGIVTGMNAGTATITYQIFNGCTATSTITVHALPAITGPTQVCAGGTVTLSSSPSGGIWLSSGGTGAASVDTAGTVTGITTGTVDITYTMGSGCATIRTMTVNPQPDPITGSQRICKGGTSQLASTSAGGVWSSTNTFVGTGNPSTGLVTSDANPPVSIFDVIYTLPTGCATQVTMTVVNAPSPISGPGQVCVGSSIMLSDTTAGGVWTSFDPSVATVTPAGGVVTGAAAGFTIITYTMGGGACYQTHVVIVNPLPAPITGNTEVCAGLTTQLSDATPTGTWTSANPAIASVTPTGGLVTGGATPGGTTTITYAIPTGCFVTTTFVTHPLPAPITGNTNICVGSTVTLSSAPAPGTWSSANTLIATVPNPNIGVIYGFDYNVPVGAPYGMTTVTYTLASTGCIRTTTVAVHPLPAVFTVTGGGSYCSGTGGLHVGLSGSQIGVNYYLYLGTATPTGPIPGTGGPLDFGVQTAGGVYTVIANNTYTTCSSNMTGSATITVIPSVTPTVSIVPSPNDTVCAGTAVTFVPNATNQGSSPVYNWSVNGLLMSVAASYTFVPADGDVVTVVLNSNAICAIPGVARDTLTMAVYPSAPPAVSIMVSPNDSVCTGTATTFTAMPYNGGPSPVYQWYVNYMAVGVAPTYTYVPANGDQVFVEMTSNSPCRIGDSAVSGVESMTLVAPVIPVVTVTGSSGSLIPAGSSDTLTATVTGGIAPTYQWYVNGAPVPGATGPTFVIDNSNYGDSIGCLVINGGFCREQAFGWMYLQVHSVGVAQVNGGNADLTVVPNPTKGVFFIKGSLGTAHDQDVTLELTNMLGQVVYHSTIPAKNGKLNNKVELDGSLANGMYMLNVRMENGNKVFHLVIEQ